MDKVNYIKANESSICDLYLDGKFPSSAKIDSSTGTSGKPTVWARSHEEIKEVRTIMKLLTNVIFPNKQFMFINCFALDLWATGLTVADLMLDTKNAITASCGSDIEKLFDLLRQMSQIDPDHEKVYIIAGYAGFIGGVIDHAKKINFAP